MDLCNCPEKEVTDQFCFDHRVYVCEHCLVSGHSRCIVKSYLHWLQDSDYNPVCTLCNGNLSSGDTLRLICYDVFHWDCLNKFASSLPPNTAPAGYTCPNCKVCVFPPNNLVSPVAEALKKKLINVNWARTGLDLPLASAQIDTMDGVEQSGSHKGSVQWFSRCCSCWHNSHGGYDDRGYYGDGFDDGGSFDGGGFDGCDFDCGDCGD